MYHQSIHSKSLASSQKGSLNSNESLVPLKNKPNFFMFSPRTMTHRFQKCEENTIYSPNLSNMSPPKKWLEDCFPSEMARFLRDILIFLGVSGLFKGQICNQYSQFSSWPVKAPVPICLRARIWRIILMGVDHVGMIELVKKTVVVKVIHGVEVYPVVYIYILIAKSH